MCATNPRHIQQMYPVRVCLLHSLVSIGLVSRHITCLFDLLMLNSCVTKGQSVQIFGNVTGGMMYDVVVDGSVSTGVPSGQVLASVSGLTTGYHNVTLIAKTSAPGEAPILLFESAVVTVGTGLTG
jgi:hypothetical protein